MTYFPDLVISGTPQLQNGSGNKYMVINFGEMRFLFPKLISVEVISAISFMPVCMYICVACFNALYSGCSLQVDVKHIDDNGLHHVLLFATGSDSMVSTF